MNIAQLRATLASLLTKLATLLNSRPTSMKEQIIYQKAAGSLGKHMTLDEAVPAEVGCAEAWSAVLALAGISDGAKGIASTSALESWIIDSGLFERITVPEAGATVISATGTGNGSVVGHVGIFGLYNKMYSQDWGIMSNESASGLFKEQWSWNRWKAYYGGAGGLNVHIYRAI